jgi:hypothetical protein
MFLALFKKLTGFDPAAVLIGIFILLIGFILIPNYDKVMGFFGYETRAVLKDKLEVANNNTEVAVNVNKDNAVTIDVLENTVINTEKVIDSKAKEDKVAIKATDTIKVKKTKKIEEILAQPDAPEKDKTNEISEVQITTIWDSYCLFNADSQCKANVSGAG